MTAIDTAIAALEQVCKAVSFGANLDTPQPDSFIVLTVLLDDAEIYAGDTDALKTVRVRAAWYERTPPQPRARQMRKALREAGFVICDTTYAVEKETGFFAAYVTAQTDESCDDTD